MNDRLDWSAVSLSYVEDDKKNSCFLSHVDCVCQRRRRKGCGELKVTDARNAVRYVQRKLLQMSLLIWFVGGVGREILYST